MWFNKVREKDIILAGLGGIGSYVLYCLAKMRPNSIYMYDDDKVEAVNLSGQLYSISDIGKYKTTAMVNVAHDYADYYSAFASEERFTEESGGAKIMICGFDNMEARKIFFNAWLKFLEYVPTNELKECLFIDGRLSAETLQVFCITGDDNFSINRYKGYLFEDNEADHTICSFKQTAYLANMIGSIIVNLFTNFVANEVMEDSMSLPFFTEYDAPSMTFNAIN